MSYASVQKTKHKKSKKMKHHEKIHRDMQNQKEELFDADMMKGSDHYNMVKPLRTEKHHLKDSLIEERLEKINFHTYETHAIEDLLADVDDEYSEDNLDDAFADFIG